MRGNEEVEPNPDFRVPDEVRERLAEGLWARFSFMRTHARWEDMSPGHRDPFYWAVDSLDLGELLAEVWDDAWATGMADAATLNRGEDKPVSENPFTRKKQASDAS